MSANSSLSFELPTILLTLFGIITSLYMLLPYIRSHQHPQNTFCFVSKSLPCTPMTLNPRSMDSRYIFTFTLLDDEYNDDGVGGCIVGIGSYGSVTVPLLNS